MSATLDALRFVEGVQTWISDAGAFSIRVSGSAASKRQLLEEIAERANFPSYFGYNWDALGECLRDLHWIRQRRVVLIHDRVPNRLPSLELKTYLQVLGDAVLDWRHPNEDHELEVVFDVEDYAVVEGVLQ